MCRSVPPLLLQNVQPKLRTLRLYHVLRLCAVSHAVDKGAHGKNPNLQCPVCQILRRRCLVCHQVLQIFRVHFCTFREVLRSLVPLKWLLFHALLFQPVCHGVELLHDRLPLRRLFPDGLFVPSVHAHQLFVSAEIFCAVFLHLPVQRFQAPLCLPVEFGDHVRLDVVLRPRRQVYHIVRRAHHHAQKHAHGEFVHQLLCAQLRFSRHGIVQRRSRHRGRNLFQTFPNPVKHLARYDFPDCLVVRHFVDVFRHGARALRVNDRVPSEQSVRFILDQPSRNQRQRSFRHGTAVVLHFSVFSQRRICRDEKV